MKIVPLSPRTMVRPPGWPLDHNSALKPAGSLTLPTGSLSASVTVDGVGCGRRVVFCLLAAGFDLSMGLIPGGPCAATGCGTSAASPMASAAAVDVNVAYAEIVMVASPIGCGRTPARAVRRTASCRQG